MFYVHLDNYCKYALFEDESIFFFLGMLENLFKIYCSLIFGIFGCFLASRIVTSTFPTTLFLRSVAENPGDDDNDYND